MKRLWFDRETQYNVNGLARRLRRKRARSRGLSRKVLGLTDFAPAGSATAGPRLHGVPGGAAGGPRSREPFGGHIVLRRYLACGWQRRPASLVLRSARSRSSIAVGRNLCWRTHGLEAREGGFHACALNNHDLRMTRSARSSHLEGYVSCFGMEKGTLERLGRQAVKKEGKRRPVQHLRIARSGFFRISACDWLGAKDAIPRDLPVDMIGAPIVVGSDVTQ